MASTSDPRPAAPAEPSPGGGSPSPKAGRHGTPKRRGWLRRVLARRTLALEIALVLTVKLAMLYAIKSAFFNQPRAPGFTLPAAAVSEALFGVPAPVDSSDSGRVAQPYHHAN